MKLPALVCALALAGLTSALGQPAAPPPGPAARDALAAFTALCLGGDMAPPAVLSRADASGWSKARPEGIDWDAAADRALGAGPGALVLAVGEAGQSQICTIGARGPTTGWVDALTAWLGLPPDASAPTRAHSANYVVVRSGEAWRRASALPAPELAQARAAGRYYSLVASDGVQNGDDRPPATFMAARAKR